MARWGTVIRYDGKRGVVWRVKFRDADGRQAMETLGPASEGWTREKAEAELEQRRGLVERGYRHTGPLTLSDEVACADRQDVFPTFYRLSTDLSRSQMIWRHRKRLFKPVP